jgi:ABC-2 type transport system ATP-binding protein
MRAGRAADGGEPMTIVLTTHYLDEADAMAERVVVVDHGEVIADDTAENLKSGLAGDRVVAQVPEPDVARFAELAANARGTRAVRAVGGVVEIRTADGPGAIPGLLRAAEADGVAVAAVQIHRPTLDDVFLALTGRSLRETGIGSAPDTSLETATTGKAAA